MTCRVFISYAKEDRQVAERLYGDLRQNGVEPWIDCVDLLVGQPWEVTIRKAIRQSDYFVALLSKQSVQKRGFVQKELRIAIEIAKEYPEDKIYILTLRLDECEPPFEDLRRLHWSDLFVSYEQGLADILRVFKYETEEKPALVIVDNVRRDGRIEVLTARGFGFLRYSYVQPTIYFHSAELQGVAFDELKVGDIVLFSFGEGPKGPAAVTVARA